MLRLVTLVLTALVAVRLYRLRIHRRYRVFFGYLLYRTARSVVLLSIPTGSPTYFWIWLGTQPILWLFYVLLVFELYRLVLENYKGIYTVGRWAMYAAMPIATAISAAALVPSRGKSFPGSSLMMYVAIVERGVVFSMVIFILLIVAFLACYPVKLPRNIAVHTIIYSTFFLSETLLLLVWALTGHRSPAIGNLIMVALGAGCAGAWLAFLQPEDQSRVVVSRVIWRHDDEEALLHQLNTLQSTLMRVAKK